jgi:hypothetical protein
MCQNKQQERPTNRPREHGQIFGTGSDSLRAETRWQQETEVIRTENLKLRGPDIKYHRVNGMTDRKEGFICGPQPLVGDQVTTFSRFMKRLVEL